MLPFPATFRLVGNHGVRGNAEKHTRTKSPLLKLHLSSKTVYNPKMLKLKRIVLVLLVLFGTGSVVFSQTDINDPKVRQEYLRGSITPEREWWDLIHYDLSVKFYPDKKMISGSNEITFKTLKPATRMQIDLQPPLAITRVKYKNSDLAFSREGNVYWIDFPESPEVGVESTILITYGGMPRESTNPPWSGGITWDHDDLGEDYIVTTCQGIGASIWWPNKDHGYDEPDRGVDVRITVPERLVAVSNGRLKDTIYNENEKSKTYHWQVKNPINNYAINANIGNYVSYGETYEGEGGTLDIQYWVLKHQLDVAKKQFVEVPRMLKAFEYWFGKYPFYEDGYKLVTVPYAGMEHQSSVTYGNWFRNGYRGRDLSFAGIGYLFDFIIVHESGHEWFGNNISMRDAADMWIHEGFTNYSENLFVEYHFGKEKGHDYVVGSRRMARNERTIIGEYGLNREGSGDMYYKGGNLLHTIRQVVNDDAKWRMILRGLNTDFAKKTVTTAQVENYISSKSGIDFSRVFDQFLRTTKIPEFRYKIEGRTLRYRYENVVDGFDMPVKVRINGTEKWLKPSATEMSFEAPDDILKFEVDKNFYVEVRKDD